MAEQKKMELLMSCFRKLEENRKDYIRELTRKLADIHCSSELMNSRKTSRRAAIKTRLIIPLMIAFMSCATAKPGNDAVNPGELTPLLAGTRWEYSEDTPNSPVYYIVLNKNGDAMWHDVKNNLVPHLTAESTWSRQGNTVTISCNSGYRQIEGTLVVDGSARKIIGTGINRHRNEWKFTMLEN